MRNALSVASECVPLVKTGGLADVVGALPGALAAEGWRLRTLLPGYPSVMAALGKKAKVLRSDDDLMGGPARVIAAKSSGLELLVLDAPHLYAREGAIYLGADGKDWPDNPERFAALSWIAAQIAAGGIGDWRPEVLHLHDWQAGLTPIYMHEAGASDVGTLLTVHNIAFHGIAPAIRLDALRLPKTDFHPDGFEYYGKISALKAGLVFADKLSTVSPTYARELMLPEFGMGLDGVLRAREADLVGILNGIDEAAWDPQTDPEIVNYVSPKRKKPNRKALLAEFGLDDSSGPLAVVISRLTHQKGLDVLLEALPAFISRGGRLALLGSGEAELESAWLLAADAMPQIGVRIGYDEALSHRMVAGADAIIVPSRFEPCGLTQLYGLRYGTIPVVSLTGGLADTIIPANDAGVTAGVATGLQFHPVDAVALSGALARLCDLYSDTRVWGQMQRRAMRHPVGWAASAPRYAALYDSLGTGS